MTGVVHIAGLDVQVNGRQRQRCAWCGALLLDYDLANIAVPVGQEGPPALWQFGTLVMVDGNLSVLVEYAEGQPLPEGACGRLDPEVTR